MVGTRLYRKKSQTRLFLAVYGLLALAGAGLAGAAIQDGREAPGAAGFMIVFGLGMFVITLLKSRKPQVSVSQDFVEVAQSRGVRTLRYRNITGVSRPDRNRLVVTLRENGVVRNEVIWSRELEPDEVERLSVFLARAKGKGR